ncbi:uncharacterized protein [Atheta coriaria]
MMYWIVFALFTCAETITDVFLSWFPFYYEIKIILVIWLLSPATKGSSFLYRKFVHPMLSSREQEIDEYISKAKEQSYKQVLDIGQKGVNALMQTALKGGGGLVNQIRKSYSLSDLTDPRHAAHDDDAISEIDGAPLRKRSPSKKRAAGISTSMYFSEIDVRTEGIVSIQSADDISSGYSSNETLLQLAGQSLPKLQQREALARGASMKVRPTRVTRAAAVSATKKSATTDEGIGEEDVIFLNDKPERLDAIPTICENPPKRASSSQSSSDNEFLDTIDASDEESESAVREIPIQPVVQSRYQGNSINNQGCEDADVVQHDTNNPNNQILKTTLDVPENEGKESGFIENFTKNEDIDKEIPIIEEILNETDKKDLEEPVIEQQIETVEAISSKSSENLVNKDKVETVTEKLESVEATCSKSPEQPSEDIPEVRRGKYHKKTAPEPPNQSGAIKATLVLQPGIIKPLGDDEVFCHSPKMRRKTKSKSRSPSPSPKLYRKLFNKSPTLSKKDVKDPKDSAMAKFMGLFKHDDKRASWHGSSNSVEDKP